jgi:hypothetical protein
MRAEDAMNGTEGKKLTAHQALCLERIRACEAAGLNTSAYAAKQGIDVRSLYDARKALKAKGVLSREASAVRFRRAEVVDRREVEWRVELPNGAAVGFSGAVDAATLSMILSTVSRLA